MKKFVVITSVHPLRKRLLEFLEYGYQIVIAGDSSSSELEWRGVKDVTFLGLKEQSELFPDLFKVTPLKNYARKNFAYLYAISQNADLILETDDDNFLRKDVGDPLTYMDFDSCRQVNRKVSDSTQVFNPYSYFLPSSSMWPRGYPLSLLSDSERSVLSSDLKQSNFEGIGIVQMLVSKHPDFDAIYRLTMGDFEVNAEPSRDILKMEHGLWLPSNTQATFWLDKSSFPWMYVPSGVSMRYADILKMYIAQVSHVIYQAGFLMEQERNFHNLLSDFQLEVPMYLSLESLLTYLGEAPADISKIYEQLVRISIVPKTELEILNVFQKEIASIG